MKEVPSIIYAADPSLEGDEYIVGTDIGRRTKRRMGKVLMTGDDTEHPADVFMVGGIVQNRLEKGKSTWIIGSEKGKLIRRIEDE
jgi:hypothetical protein